MRWVFALLVFAGLVPCGSPAAQAQSAPGGSEGGPAPPSFLSVTRADGAEGCPDTATLREHVDRLRGPSATSAPSAYRVRFSYEAGVFRAEIEVGASSDARVLRDRGATCASLEQATALTLALLLDSDASEPLPPKSGAEAAAPPSLAPAPASARAHPEPEEARNTTHFAFSLGGGALFGVAQPVAPALLAELGIGVNRFRTGIGLLWVPTQTREFGPGQLREQLLSGVARTCLTALRANEARFDVCSGIYAGLRKVSASDYTRNGAADKTWLALPVGFALATTSSPVGFELAASALVPLRRDDFSIDNLGVAYESWPVGVLVSLRAVGAWLL